MQNLACEEAGVGNFSCEGSLGTRRDLVIGSDILSLVKTAQHGAYFRLDCHIATFD